MTLLLEELTRDQIAERLMLGSQTVNNQATSIYSKPGVHSVREPSTLVMDGAGEKDAKRIQQLIAYAVMSKFASTAGFLATRCPAGATPGQKWLDVVDAGGVRST